MHDDEYKHRAQELEQVIATVFACRSVIKYNLSVDEKQQGQILQDIDASLEVLRASVLTTMALGKPPLTDLPIGQTESTNDVQTHDDTLKSSVDAQEILQALYRMYHAFIDVNEQTNIQSFVIRFNEVISALEEVQRLFEERPPFVHDRYSSSVLLDSSPTPMIIENLLQKTKVFICDLYYIFMDFIRALSVVLQQNDVHLSTDKISAFPGVRRSEKIRRIQLERLHEHTPQDVQEAYQQLYRRRLRVEPQVSEIKAFLEFLKEILREPETQVYQLGEILAQTDAVSRLLAELLHIVAEYEKITKI